MGNENENSQHPETEVPLTQKELSQLESGSGEGKDSARQNIVSDNRRQSRGFLQSKNSKKILIILLLVLLFIIIGAYLLYAFLSNKEELKSEIDSESSQVKDKKDRKPIEIPNPVLEQGPSPSTLHVFKKAAVCSDSDICSKIGIDILHRGGNAVDSTLATLFCSGITTMQSLGIGGGFIMNVYIKTEKKAFTIDAREVAPFAATEDMFKDKPAHASYKGPLSIAVPGEVMGYHEAFKRYASMPWKELIEPAIAVCEKGFKLSKHMWDSLNFAPSVKNDTHLRNMFVNNVTEEFHKVGSHVYPPKELCNTYRKLSLNGAKDFYDGELAKLIAEDLKDIGSIITLNDLRVYVADVPHSISVKVNEDIMYVVPPAGSGAVVANIVNILRGYKLSPDSIANDSQKIELYHRMAEAFKFGFAKRFDLGDLRFNRELGELISNLTSPWYGDEIRRKIYDNQTFDDPKHYGANYWDKDEHGTSHLSVMDQNGNAVSVTSSINFYFGSSLTGPRTGIVFNSGMEDYSKPGSSNMFGLPSSKPNFITPRKRAMSSMSPTIITDDEGNVKLVIGAAGGSKIPTSIAQVIVRVLWLGQDIKEAIDAARIHHQLIPNKIEYEYGVIKSVIEGLEAKGHKTLRYRERGSTMCGITRNSTTTNVYANADYRKAGDVAGI